MSLEIKVSGEVGNAVAAGRDVQVHCGGNVSVGMVEYIVPEEDHENGKKKNRSDKNLFTFHCLNFFVSDSPKIDQNSAEIEQDKIQELFKMIDAVKKKLESQEKLRAIKYSWGELDMQVKTMNWENEQCSEQHNICTKIRCLTKKFIEYGNTEMARKSIRCEFDLIKRFCIPGKHRLEKLQHLGMSMQIIASKECGGQFKAEYKFMDDILDEMQGIALDDANVELKCQFVTCFCISYAYCCIETGTFAKAIEILQRANFAMHFVFGKEYSHNLSQLSHCHSYHTVTVTFVTVTICHSCHSV